MVIYGGNVSGTGDSTWLAQYCRRLASLNRPGDNRLLYISVTWPDPIFAQGRYHFQYKRGPLILNAITPLRENRIWLRETNPLYSSKLRTAVFEFLASANENRR